MTPMADRWYYTQETSIYGPVALNELRRLIQANRLRPTDLVWPDGEDSATAVPAVAAFWVSGTRPAASAPLAGRPAPDWLPALAAALASGWEPTAESIPLPAAWLDDVRRVEESCRPE
jgi:hypothetical protein